MSSVAASSGAVIQPALDHLGGERLGYRNTVEYGLQHRSASDDQLGRRTVLPGLMVGDAQLPGLGVPLDQIDRSPQDEPAVHRHRLETAPWITAFVAQSETELEIL